MSKPTKVKATITTLDGEVLDQFTASAEDAPQVKPLLYAAPYVIANALREMLERAFCIED